MVMRCPPADGFQWAQAMKAPVHTSMMHSPPPVARQLCAEGFQWSYVIKAFEDQVSHLQHKNTQLRLQLVSLLRQRHRDAAEESGLDTGSHESEVDQRVQSKAQQRPAAKQAELRIKNTFLELSGSGQGTLQHDRRTRSAPPSIRPPAKPSNAKLDPEVKKCFDHLPIQCQRRADYQKVD